MRIKTLLRRLTVVLAASVALVGCQQTPPPEPGTAVNAYARDGDTLSVSIGGVGEIVRILGIDAPERDMCGADEAKLRLGELTHGQTLSIVRDPVSDERDRFGRILAYVEVDGVDIGLQMITDGRAEAWWPRSEPEPARGRGYLKASKAARDDGIGSWGSCETLGRG